MKKAYMTPAMQVTSVGAEELICESLGTGETTSDMGTVSADAQMRIADEEANIEQWGNLW